MEKNIRDFKISVLTYTELNRIMLLKGYFYFDRF